MSNHNGPVPAHKATIDTSTVARAMRMCQYRADDYRWHCQYAALEETDAERYAWLTR